MAESAARETRKVTIGCQFCLTPNRVDIGRLKDGPKCGKCGRPILLDRPVKVTDDSLASLIDEAEALVVVDFYADWCGPCKVMAPVLDDFARDRMGELVVAKLDTDLNPKSTRQYGIRGIPTLVAFRDGKEVARQTGAVPRERLEELVDSVGE